MFGLNAAAAKHAQQIARQEELKKKRRDGTKIAASSTSACKTRGVEKTKKRSISIDESTGSNATLEQLSAKPLGEAVDIRRGDTSRKGLLRGMLQKEHKNSSPANVEIGTENSETTTMSNVVGSPVTESDKKQQSAKDTLNMIRRTITSQEQRETQLDETIAHLLHEAKMKLRVGNKRAAVRCMRRVKLNQCEQEKIAAAIETMEAQCMSIESSLSNAEVMKAMQAGSNTMKTLQSNLPVEQIDIAMENVREMVDYAAEVNQILSKPVDDIVMDDDDLLKELAALESESTDNGICMVDTEELKNGERFPTVPSTKPMDSSSANISTCASPTSTSCPVVEGRSKFCV